MNRKGIIYFAIVPLFLCLYWGGIFCLAKIQAQPLSCVPAFRPDLAQYGFVPVLCSLITILAGTTLIYFIPGVLIADYVRRKDESGVEVFVKGLLLNYLYYYVGTALVKAYWGHGVTRQSMIALMGIAGLLTGLVILLSNKKNLAKGSKIVELLSRHRLFVFMYVAVVVILFCLFRQKIFLNIFGSSGDEAEQYWLAFSLKSALLPTNFEEPCTLVTQFPFAPSLYLNMYSLVLFGKAELAIRIQVLVAFLCLGFIIKGIIARNQNSAGNIPFRWIPAILSLITYFVIICFRADYTAPTGLGKSSETLFLLLFLCGFHLLVTENKAFLPAVLFLLASMIRYNAAILTVFFLAVFPVIFRRYRCFMLFLLGWILSILVLYFAREHSSYTLDQMFIQLLRDLGLEDIGCIRSDLVFFLRCLGRYCILTAGLPLFYVLGLKDRKCVVMLVTSVFYLFLTAKMGCVPAHFFGPIFMFPLLAFYFSGSDRKRLLTSAVAMSQVIALVHMSPLVPTWRARAFENVLSKVCLNAADMRDAYRKSSLLNENLWDIDELTFMYYVDMKPQDKKKYLVYFDTLPKRLTHKYDCVQEEDVKIYFAKGLTWDIVRESFCSILEDYYRGDTPYVTSPDRNIRGESFNEDP